MDIQLRRRYSQSLKPCGLQKLIPNHRFSFCWICTGSLLQLASSSRHWCLHTEQPQAQHMPTSIHWWQSTSPPEAWELRVSNASWCHHREAQNRSSGRFHSPFLAGGMNFSPRSGMLNPWQFSSNTWKLISSVFCFFIIKKTTKNTFAPFPFPSPCLASFCYEQWLKCCITSTSCDCLPLYNVSLIYSSIVSRFG